MQYVGRFVSSVYNTITPNINPATLSGAIDVIVVEREVEVEEEVPEGEPADGISPTTSKRTRKVKRTELASTPFHVRFGKMSVLRPGERKVTLHLNNSTDPLPFAMKVGEQGEAFFVVEIDDMADRDQIPDDLVTSPILSPTTSPGLAPSDGDQQQQRPPPSSSADVEPLELGDAADAESAASESRSATGTHASSKVTDTDDDTVITTPGEQSRSPSSDNTGRQYRHEATGAEDGPLKVPHDSDRVGSGSNSTTGILGQLGNAASKAGGAIGAAGRAVGVKADNPRLERLANNAAKNDPVDKETGAPVDEDHKDEAEQYHPQQHNPPGKQRQQEAQDEKPTPPLSETEKLEKEMKEQAQALLREEHEALQRLQEESHNRSPSPAPSTSSTASLKADANEEAYPAPFGGTTSSGTSDKKGQPRINTFPVAQSDHGDFIAGHKLLGSQERDKYPFEPAAIDPRTVQNRIDSVKEGSGPSEQVSSHGMLRGHSKQAPEEEVADGDVAQKPPQRKEDLQYMLDMDGYKMTADGEDLAFAEGHRLAHELPLSRRHGGDEIHPHIGELLDQAHRRERAGIAHVSEEGPIKASVDDSTVHSARRMPPAASNDTHDDLLTADPTAHAFGARSSRIQHEDSLFGRDLARAARLLRPQGDDESEASEEATHPVGGSQRRLNRVRRRLQDVSLSDTEADFQDEASGDDDADADETWSARKTHMRAKSGPFDFSTGLRDEEARDGSSNSARRGDPGSRQRVQSHSAGDGLKQGGASSVDELPVSTRSESNLPRFVGSDADAYTFVFVSDDGTRHSFEMSLCYKEGFGTGHNQDEDGSSEEEEFEESRVSFQRFLDDPDVVNDERLVLLYKERYLTWENASTILATLSFYRHSFAAARGQEDAAAKAQQRTAAGGPRGSVWSRWWYRNRDSTVATPPGDRPSMPREASAPPEDPSSRLTAPQAMERAKSDPNLLEDDSGAAAKLSESRIEPSAGGVGRPTIDAAGKAKKTYAKTLRLTSDQLKSLNLKKGANTITFSVTSSYSGVATCTARIFLWESTHHIVVSDIDGTITKSDALGHVFTMIGRDWTHLGVAKLYTDIARNGYRIMYLTSRAIGQADTTRDYLRGISQNNYRLPDGPVIMSPDRLIASLHREVILRKPEVFKMACLRDIARLFGSDPRKSQAQPGAQWPSTGEDATKAAADKMAAGAGKEESPSGGAATAAGSNATPFYAGFGNRITDALSYRSVNIPSSRIFTIDTNGEVKMELLELAGYKSSYIHMTDLVDQMFPPITSSTSEKKTGKPEYNDFNFWRPQISAEFELPSDDDLIPSPPVSPALSARSGRSVRSRTSVKSSATDNEQQLQQQGRLSRFGLGSLGLSRKGSSQTVGNDGPQHSHTIANDAEASAAGVLPHASSESHLPLHQSDGPHRANSAPPEPEQPAMPSSYGSGTSSWIAPWRRRAASPTSSNAALSPPQATSPLVGPVITAEPDSEEDEDEDDDVSSFGGDEDGQYSDEEGEADGSYEDEDGTRGRRSRSMGRQSSGLGDSVLEDDELLATGEVQFDWRG